MPVTTIQSLATWSRFSIWAFILFHAIFNYNLGLVDGFLFEVPPGQIECFWESVTEGSLIYTRFQVIQGGSHDIDVSFTFKSNLPETGERLVIDEQRRSEEMYSFIADQEGIYKFCFSNVMSSVTPKTVSFTLNVRRNFQIAKEPTDHFGPLEQSVELLMSQVQVMKDEQQYMHAREILTRDVVESTNSRVLWYSLLEAFLLVAIGFCQILSIKRFFEVKRVV
jgi:hypothetical protein